MDRSKLLTLAYGLGDNDVNQMALALGWPTTDQPKWARVRWQSPFRNGADYINEGLETMGAIADLGLAIRGRKGEGIVAEHSTHFRLNDLGIAVLRLALHAERDARKLGGES